MMAIGLVQIRAFSGSTSASGVLTFSYYGFWAARSSAGGFRTCRRDRSGRLARETTLAQQFQPVLVFLPAQQLRRTLALTLGTLAPQETTVIQKKLQQRQRLRTDLT